MLHKNLASACAMTPYDFLPTTLVKEAYFPAFAARVKPSSAIFFGERPTILPLARQASSSESRFG